MRVPTTKSVIVIFLAALFLTTSVPAVHAFDWPNRLSKKDHGRMVKRLQVRVAGWFPARDRTRFRINGSYGNQTANAVERFERHYGIDPANGAAGPKTFAVLERLADKDGSTRHFSWGEFTQHSNSGCSAQANAYAGTFNGGRVSAKRTKRNVRRLMWRLEAVRAKAGGDPVGINSGFRSAIYNSCIGGASASQHQYGTAADNRVAGISNAKARRIARRSQVSGIGCYSNTTHNHFDLRIENRDLPSAQTWWWPDKDSLGRELDDSGRPCWGESTGSRAPVSSAGTSVLQEVSLIPSAAEVRAFEEAGEPADLAGSD